MSARPYRYRLFGLTVASDVPLSELISDDGTSQPDLTIATASLSPDLPHQPGFHLLGDGALLVIEGVGRYLARDGRELRIEPAPGVPARNLRLFLLGSGLAMLLHQRGLLPLHANAVVIDGKAYAFMGPSGSGKSTLAAWFQDHGFPLCCDDVCVISLDAAGQPLVHLGLPRLRLWRDALERSGRDVSGFARSFEEDDDDWEKYDVPAAPGVLAASPVLLGGVFLLADGEPARVDYLSGPEAVQLLFANIYRGEYLSAGQHERQWRTCLALAAQVSVGRWFRPWSLDSYETEVQRLIALIRRKNGQ